MLKDEMHSKSPFAVAGLSAELVQSLDAASAVKVANDLLRAQLLEVHPDKVAGQQKTEAISDLQSALSTALEDLDVSGGLAEALRKSYLAENPFSHQIDEARFQVVQAARTDQRYAELFVEVIEAMAASPAPHYLAPVPRKIRLVDPVAMVVARRMSDSKEDQKMVEDSAASIDQLADKLLGRNKPVMKKFFQEAFEDLRDHGPNSLMLYISNRLSKEDPGLEDRMTEGRQSKADERRYSRLQKAYQADFEKTQTGKKFLREVEDKARELQERALTEKLISLNETAALKMSRREEDGPLSPSKHAERTERFRRQYSKEHGFDLLVSSNGELALADKGKKIPHLKNTRLVGYIAYAVLGTPGEAKDYSPQDFASEVFLKSSKAIAETQISITKFGETELSGLLSKYVDPHETGSSEFGISIKVPKSTTADHLVLLIGLVTPKASEPYLTVLGLVEDVSEKKEVKRK